MYMYITGPWHFLFKPYSSFLGNRVPGDGMIQLDIPLGKIAKRLAGVSDEVVLYGKAAGPLYLVAMDPSQSLLVQIDAGIALDEDLKAGIPTKELGETSKGARYFMDYDKETWNVTYETATGLRVKKKMAGLEPSIPVEELVGIEAKTVSETIVDYVTLSHALGEVEGDVVSMRFVKGKPGRLIIKSRDASKEIEVEATISEVAKDFEVKVNPVFVMAGIDALEPLTRSFSIGVTEKGLLVIKPNGIKSDTRVLIAPVAD